MTYETIINIPEKNILVIIYRNFIPDDIAIETMKSLEIECVEKINDNKSKVNCFYADAGINELKISKETVIPNPWNDNIRKIKNAISSSNIFKPNVCIVSGLISSSDSINKKRENNLNDINNTLCIGIIGGTRRMIFRSYEQKECEVKLPKKIEIEINNGDVLYMYGNTNEYFSHEIPSIRKKESFIYKKHYSVLFKHI